MTATLILVRHAAHIHFDERLSGRMPGVPLSDAGLAQAERLAAALAGRIDVVIASPLLRAQDTARAIAQASDVPVETDEALVEIDLGEWTGRSFASLKGDAAWDLWNAERATARPPGGESMAEAQARIVAAMARIVAAYPGRSVVLVSHSDMIRAAVAHTLGLGLDGLDRFDISPASRTTIVMGDWGARVLALNEGLADA